MKNSKAIFIKQIKDTFKNKTVLIQFIMFPILTILMEKAVNVEELPEHFFVNMFAAMYIGMAPLTAMSAVISEEKEKNTLRALLLSNVKPMEYLLGIGAYVWSACMIGAYVFAVVGEYRGKDLISFLVIMAVGILASSLIGAAIGTWSSSQMAATSLSVPAMIVFSFLPMISQFNESVKNVAKYVYSQQISLLISDLTNVGTGISIESLTIILLNTAVAFLCFILAYRKCGLA